MARINRNDEVSSAGAEEAAQRAAEEARARAAEDARRRAEEAARLAKEAAKRAAEAAARANSKMEDERKIRRDVRPSVGFDEVKKLPARVKRESVRMVLTNARAEKVELQGAAEAAKEGVLGGAWVKAVKANDVQKMEQLALPRLEKVAMQAADLVDGVQQQAFSVAKAALQKNLAGAVDGLAEVHGAVSAAVEQLKGRAKWGAEGLAEMMPKLADQVAHAHQWAKEGLELGDVHASAAGLRKQLGEVVDTVGMLHQANDTMRKIGGAAWNAQAVAKGLHGIEDAAVKADHALSLAEGRSHFVEGHATRVVNEARGRLGYEQLDAHAAPEEWMPAKGEHPSASNVRKSDDPGSEVGRLAGKLEELKARKAAGENVDEAMHSVKANLRNAESVFESGATSMTGKPAPAAEEGVPQLPEGVTMGPDGVPMDKDGMPLGLSEEDVKKLGTQVPKDGGVQVMWSRNDGFPEGAPGALPSSFADKARQQGLISPEQVKASQELANKTVSGEETKEFEIGDVALLAKQAGIPLEKMDPNQLAQATKLLNSGKTAQEQRDCVSVAVQNLQLIAGGKPPSFNKDEMKAMMWAQSKLPGHAVDKLSESELAKKFQESAAATNAPGEHAFKIGKYNTTIKVSEDGDFESSKCKKPSLLSKIGKIAKIVTKVGAIIPGPWQPFCAVACGVMAAVDAIKSRSWLGLVGAVASVVAGPAGGMVQKIANGVKAVANGIQSIKRGGVGGILGGIASIAGGVGGAMGAFGDKLGKIGEKISKYGNDVGKVAQAAGAAEGVIKANKALGEAKANLEKARASGDPAAIADALKGVEEAERGKRSSLLGAAATGLTLAAGSMKGGKDAAGNPLAAGQRSALQFGLQVGADAFNVARNVNDKNYVGALVDGVGMAADLKQGTKAPHKIDKQATDKKTGRPLVGPDGKPVMVQDGGDRFGLRNVADAAQGLNGWREAEGTEKKAKAGVTQAEAALAQAKASKNPEAIKQAEEQLKKAKRGAADAQMGTWSGVFEARDAVERAVTSWKDTKAFDQKIAAELPAATKAATDERAKWGAESASEKNRDGVKTAAAESDAKVEKAQEQLTAALEKGDKAAIAKAKKELEATVASGRVTVGNAKFVQGAEDYNAAIDQTRTSLSETAKARGSGPVAEAAKKADGELKAANDDLKAALQSGDLSRIEAAQKKLGEVEGKALTEFNVTRASSDAKDTRAETQQLLDQAAKGKGAAYGTTLAKEKAKLDDLTQRLQAELGKNPPSVEVLDQLRGELRVANADTADHLSEAQYRDTISTYAKDKSESVRKVAAAQTQMLEQAELQFQKEKDAAKTPEEFKAAQDKLAKAQDAAAKNVETAAVKAAEDQRKAAEAQAKAKAQAAAAEAAKAKQSAQQKDSLNRVASAAMAEVNFANDDDAKVHGSFSLPNMIRAAGNIMSNPEERQKARDAYQTAAMQLSITNNKADATPEQRQAALNRVLETKQKFYEAEGKKYQAQTEANLGTIARVGAEELGRQIERVGTPIANTVADTAKRLGVPEHLAEGVRGGLTEAVHQYAGMYSGLARGFVDANVGLAELGYTLVTHPIDTTRGLATAAGTAIDRVAQASVPGRAVQFLANAAMGAYSSPSEAAKDFARMMDPVDLARAQLQLGKDAVNLIAGDAVKYAKNGEYGKALGYVIGGLVDPAIIAGGFKAGGKAVAREAGEQIERRVANVAKEAEGAAIAAKKADDVARMGREAKAAQKLEQRVDDLARDVRGGPSKPASPKPSASEQVGEAYAAGTRKGEAAVKQAEADFARKNPGKALPRAEKERIFGDAFKRHVDEAVSPEVARDVAKQLEGKPLGDIGQHQLDDLQRRSAQGKLGPMVENSEAAFARGSKGPVDCGFAQASSVHQLRELGVPDKNIFVHQATEAFGGPPELRHSFVAAEVDGKLFYVDSSFKQFTDPSNAYRALGDRLPPGLRNELAEKGFVELTEKNADAIGKMFNPEGTFTPASFRTSSALKEAKPGSKIDDVLDFTKDEVGLGRPRTIEPAPVKGAAPGQPKVITPSEAFERDFAAFDFETGNARARAKAAELKGDALRAGQLPDGFGADDVGKALENRRITDKAGNRYQLKTSSDGGRVRVEIRTESGELAGIANRVVSTPGELGIGAIELSPKFQNQGIGQGLYKALADISPPGTTFQLNITEAATSAKVAKWYDNALAKGMTPAMATEKVGALFDTTPWGKILKGSGWEVGSIEMVAGAPQIKVVKPGLASEAIGPLKAPKRAVLRNEGILIGPEHGLQSRTTGRFDAVMVGSHGDAKTKYLWTIDERGVNVVHELTAFPTPRNNVVHTNLSPQAAIGGEAWFGPNNTVTINPGSGRFGDAAGITESMWRSAVKYWESLGYKVTPTLRFPLAGTPG